ncbi:MAG TPA: helix-turn-helix domain-containing protein [Candidatus Solibacter sp.]|nr:helix-turn-helix domain-containing protein [Candidatus Solibacter sp.]
MTDRFEGFADQLLNGGVSLGEATSLLERSMIHAALSRNGNNQSAAARVLGVHRNTLQRKMVEFGMDAARPRARRKPMSRAGHPRGKKSKPA